MELLKDVPLAESEFNLLSILLNPVDESPPLENMSHTAAAILMNLSIEKYAWATHASMLSSILIDRENSFPKTEGDDARRPFRSKTLSLLQANFKNRDELKSQGEKYQGLVAYIAGLYRTVRVAEKELSILTGPLYNCLNDLAVTGGQADVQCLMAQLQIVGQQLEVSNLDKMNDLFVSIRNCFLKSSTTPLCRRMLLEIIEVRAGKWCLSKAAYEYYYCQKLNLSEIPTLPVSNGDQNGNKVFKAEDTVSDEDLTALLQRRRQQANDKPVIKPTNQPKNELNARYRSILPSGVGFDLRMKR